MSKHILISVSKRCFFLVLLCGYYSCSDNTSKKDDGYVSQPSNIKVEEEKKLDKDQNTKEDANEEINEEALDLAVDVSKLVITNLKVNDSIRRANRSIMFAFQIGLPIKNLEEVFEVYNSLSDIESVYILKLGRKEHYLIKYEGKTEEELLKQKEVFKQTLSSEVTGGVKVVNLMRLCSKKAKLMVGEKILNKEEKIEIPCLICK